MAIPFDENERLAREASQRAAENELARQAAKKPGTAVVPSNRPSPGPDPGPNFGPVRPDAPQYSDSRELGAPSRALTVPPQAPDTPPPQTVAGKLRNAAAAAEPLVTGAVAGLGGAAAAGMVNNARQGALNAQPKMEPRPDAPGQIPVNPADVAPPAAAGSLLSQSELGRNVGNALMALPAGRGMANGVAAGAEALTRAAAATKSLPLLERAAPIATATGAAAKGYVAGDAAFPGQPGAGAQPRPTSLAQSFPQASYSNEGNNYPTPETAGQLRAQPIAPGQIIKRVGADGRISYESSGGPVKEGAGMFDPNGKALEMRGGFVGSPPGATGAGAAGNSYLGSMAHEQRIAQSIRDLNTAKQDAAIREQNLRDGKPENLGTSTGPMGGGGMLQSNWYKEEADARARQMDMEQMLRGMSPRARANFATQMAVTERNNAVTMRGQDIGAETSRYGADTSAASNRYSSDNSLRSAAMHDTTARRGQDMTAANHAESLRSQARGNELQAQRLQYDMAKDERTYRDGRYDKGLEQRYAGENALDKRLSDRFQTIDPKTGKAIPDAPRITEYRQQFDRAVARAAQDGQKIDGVHQLNGVDQERILAATDMLKRLRADSSGLATLNPLAPDQISTVDAYDLIGAQRNEKTGNYVITSGPAKGYTIPGRYFENEQANRITLGGMRGDPTNRFNILAQGQ